MFRLLIRLAGFIFLFYRMCALTDASAEGEVRSLKDFLYWDNGAVKQCTVYDAGTGKLKAKAFCSPGGVIEKVEKFDERGNKIEAAFYDEKGNLRAGLDEWAAMRWKYDGSQIVWQVSYDEYGKPIERKFYTSSGKLAMRLYREDDSVNPYVNAAMYTMLGGQNIAYYDPSETFEEFDQLIKGK